MILVGEAEASNAGVQLARNSRPETHSDEPRDSSRGGSRNLSVRSIHRDRFPYALENSLRQLVSPQIVRTCRFRRPRILPATGTAERNEVSPGCSSR
jgi:hypothetical protein